MKKILPLSTFPVVIGVIILVVLFNGISSRNSFASLQSGQFVKTKTEVPSFESRLIALRIVTVEQVKKEMTVSLRGGVPVSVVRSARELEHLTKSISKDVEAELFLQKMKSCLGQPTRYPLSIQVVCIRFSKLVAQKHPRMGARFESLMKMASSEVKIMEAHAK